MSASGKKPIIGILGGIGSGKSTVAGEFAKLGCAVIDADKLAHSLLEEDDIRAQIVGLFGPQICDSSGNIDRKKLAETVFSDCEKLGRLNKIIHPRVLAQGEELIRQYNEQDDVKAIVLDMPLLAEVGWDKRCDRIVFVECDRQIRAQRAEKAGFFDEKQQRIRENFQNSLDSKASLADNSINNNSDFSELVRQVVSIFSSILDSW
ncbi:MAG: dephospho-CoA kinase [Planctomycetota bacterium]